MTIKNKKAASIIGILLISLTLAAVICVCLLPKPMFHGDYPYYPDVDSITDAADVIIVGEVLTAREVENLMVDMTPNKADKETTPYTLSTVKILNVIKGDVKIGDVITVKQLGDYKNKPEQTLYEMDGYLSEDTEQLMFLCEFEDCPYSAVNPSQGIIEVRDGVLYSNNRYSLFGYSADGSQSVDYLNTVVESIKQYID